MRAAQLGAVRRRDLCTESALRKSSVLSEVCLNRDVKGDFVDCLNVWLEMTMLNGTYRTLPFFAQGLLENAGVSQSINDMLLTSHGCKRDPSAFSMHLHACRSPT